MPATTDRLVSKLLMQTMYVGRRLLFRTPLQRSRLVGLVYQRIFEAGAPDLTEPVPFRGTELYVDPDNRSLVPSVVAGYYEARELDIFEALAPHASTFFDVGANIGMYSVLGCLAAPALRARAFEPVAENEEILRRNLRLHGLADRVTVEPVGVSDRSGSATIGMHADSGMHSFDLNADSGMAREVPIVSLDDVSARSGETPDLMKIDVEGHEPQVLAGAAQMLQRCHPTVFVEYLPHAHADLDALLSGLRSIAETCFVVDEISGRVTEVPTARLDRRRSYNLVLAPDPGHAAIVRRFVSG